MTGFKVAVTVKAKNSHTPPIWNKVHLGLSGDPRDLKNLQAQLELVKSDVNTDMNKKGISLKSVSVSIDFI